MIIIIPTIKYGSTYYNTFTMGVCSNFHGYFFQCRIIESTRRINVKIKFNRCKSKFGKIKCRTADISLL